MGEEALIGRATLSPQPEGEHRSKGVYEAAVGEKSKGVSTFTQLLGFGVTLQQFALSPTCSQIL